MKTEREKTLAGELYNALDTELVQERACGRDLYQNGDLQLIESSKIVH